MRLTHFAGTFAAASLAVGSFALAQSAPPEAGPADPTAAAPTSHAQDADNPLAADRRVWLGIEAAPVSPALAHQLRLPPGVGLVVDAVTPDSPAAKAGLKEYDVLHKLDGRLVASPGQLVRQLRLHKPGDQVTLEVFREGQPTGVNVMLEAGGPAPAVRPEDAPAPPLPAPRDAAPAPRRPRPADPFRKLRIPNVKLRIEGGDLVARDEAGHILFRQPLELDIDDDRLPFSIHIHPRDANRHDSDARPQLAPRPEQPNAGDAVPDPNR